MWKKILAGEIDFMGSDHATYTFEEKEPGFKNIFDTLAGVTGVQTWVPHFFSEAVNRRNMSLNKFAEMTATNAAKRFNLYPRKGVIEIGADADLILLDPNEELVIKASSLLCKKKWTPYNGHKVQGRIKKTILRGKIVYDEAEAVGEPGGGKLIKPM